MQRKVFALLCAVLLVLCLGLIFAAGCSSVDDNDANGDAANDNGEAPGEVNGDVDDEPAEFVRGNSGGNIVNGGLVDGQGEYIYFSSRIDGGKLYRAMPDGSDPLRLTDEEVRYINVVGEYIYYVAMGEPETYYDEAMDEDITYEVYGPVVRINLGGGGRTVISPDAARFLQVAGDWLYYREADDPYYLYKVKNDQSGLTALADHRVGEFVVDGDWIYYVGIIDWPKLFKMRVDGSESSELYDNSVWFLNVMDESIYFVGDIFPAGAYLGGEHLYRLGIDGTGLGHVGDIDPMYLNADGGRLYYTTSYGGQIHKSMPDGSEPFVLVDGPCSALFVIGQWLYYTNPADDGRLYRVGIDGSGRQRIE